AGDGKKAWSTVQKMSGYFSEKLKEKEFVNLGLFELGFVYVVSRKKIANLDELGKVKLWAWEGDNLAASMIQAMKLISVPLALPDVLSSLSTGIIDAAYAPPMGIVALQWNSKIRYLVDFPIAYSIGAFLVHEKYWNRIPENLRKIVVKIADPYIAKVNAANMRDNKESLQAIREMGVNIINFSDKDKTRAKSYRKKVIAKLTGDLFSKEALDKLNQARK
ncbi:MAG: TRAP transporter substrate-binding protein DctP, partial [Halobacteriovoraceae bacterium]|nr:TRAP transporter substrate-binding protein DctP [Halobacteriovoraceae bacterium]